GRRPRTAAETARGAAGAPSRAEPYGRLDAAAVPGLGDADRALAVGQADGAVRVDVDERAVPCAARLLAVDRDDRQERGEHVPQRDERFAVGRGDAPGADARAAQRLAVGIAQLGDERADVRAAAALDLVAAALAVLAAPLLRATDR